MIRDITGDGAIQTAIQRAFQVLGIEQAIDVVGYLETQPHAAISVLRLLEAIEHRRKPSVASVPWPSRRIPTTASAWKTMIRRKRKRIAAKSRG
jgi:hypothetical protein